MRAALDAPSEPADVLNIAEKSIYEIAEGIIEKGFVALDRITRTNMTAIEQLQRRRKADHRHPHRLRPLQRVHLRVPEAGPDHHRRPPIDGKDVAS